MRPGLIQDHNYSGDTPMQKYEEDRREMNRLNGDGFRPSNLRGGCLFWIVCGILTVVGILVLYFSGPSSAEEQSYINAALPQVSATYQGLATKKFNTEIDGTTYEFVLEVTPRAAKDAPNVEVCKKFDLSVTKKGEMIPQSVIMAAMPNEDGTFTLKPYDKIEKQYNLESGVH